METSEVVTTGSIFSMVVLAIATVWKWWASRIDRADAEASKKAEGEAKQKLKEAENSEAEERRKREHYEALILRWQEYGEKATTRMDRLAALLEDHAGRLGLVQEQHQECEKKLSRQDAEMAALQKRVLELEKRQ